MAAVNIVSFQMHSRRHPFQIDHIIAEKHGGPSTLLTLLGLASTAIHLRALTSLDETGKRNRLSRSMIHATICGITISIGNEECLLEKRRLVR